MNPITRTILGVAIWFLGLLVLVYTIINFRHMPKAIVEVKTEVPTMIVKTQSPTIPPLVPSNSNIKDSGVLWVQYRHEFQNKWSTGDYQVENSDGNIWTMKFCNDPYPELDEGYYYRLYYESDSIINSKDACLHLRRAQVEGKIPKGAKEYKYAPTVTP